MTNNAEGWDEITLSDFGSIVAGGTPSRSMPSYWNGDIPWVTPSEITRLGDKYLRATNERITRAGLAGSAARLLPAGAVLVTTRATLCEVAIAAIPVATNQGFKSIVPNSDTDSLFAYYQMKTCRRRMESLASGTTFLEISKADFERIRTQRPAADQQRRIAAVLDTMDAAIEKTAAVIAKLRQMRAGLLHDLLTHGLDTNGELRDPVKHPNQFQDSQLGRIPREWNPGILDDLVLPARPIVYGILMPGRGYRGGVPVVKVKDIRDGRVDTSDLLLTDPKIDAAYARSRLKPNELLFTIRGTVGRMALVPASLDGANITQDTARIALANSNPVFIARWLEMEAPTRFVAVHTLGVAVQGINLRDVRRIPTPVVPRPEQDQIVKMIESCEATIEREHQAFLKLALVKAGLMSDLLTGGVRVPVNIATEVAS